MHTFESSEPVDEGILKLKPKKSHLALGFCNFFVGAGASFIYHANINYSATLHHPREKLDSLVWMQGLPNLLFFLFASPFVILHRKVSLLFGLLLASATVSLIFTTQDFALIGSLLVLFGFASSVYATTRDSIVAGLTAPQEAGLSFGWLFSMHWLGYLVAVIVNLVFILHRVPSYPIYMVASACMLTATISAIFLKNPETPYSGQLLFFSRRYGLYYTLALLLGSSLAFYHSKIWIGFSHNYGSSFWTNEWIYVCGSLIVIITFPLSGYLIDRYGERKALTWFAIGLVVSCLACITNPSSQAFIIAILLEFVAMTFTLALTTYLAKITAPGEFFQTYAVGLSLTAIGATLAKYCVKWTDAAFHNIQIPLYLSAILAAGVIVAAQRIRTRPSSFNP